MADGAYRLSVHARLLLALAEARRRLAAEARNAGATKLRLLEDRATAARAQLDAWQRAG